jgi:hypothetical protein
MPALTPSSYVLTCNDRELEQALRAWLESSKLTWPGGIELSVEVVDSLPVRDDTRETFTMADLEVQAGAPEGTVRVRWTSPAADAVIHETLPRATVIMTREAVAKFEMAERSFLLVVLLFVLRRVGWYHIHCAALVDPRGRGWIFVGQSHSGKSTTSALLAAHGWSVSTDDIAFVNGGEKQATLHGFAAPIALREGGQSLLGATGGLDFSRRGKMGFQPQDLGGGWIPTVTPEVIVFPTVGERTSLEPVTPREAMNMLIASSIWVLFETVHAQEHLDSLSRLVSQSKAFKGTIGPDLLRDPNLLLELMP